MSEGGATLVTTGVTGVASSGGASVADKGSEGGKEDRQRHHDCFLSDHDAVVIGGSISSLIVVDDPESGLMKRQPLGSLISVHPDSQTKTNVQTDVMLVDRVDAGTFAVLCSYSSSCETEVYEGGPWNAWGCGSDSPEIRTVTSFHMAFQLRDSGSRTVLRDHRLRHGCLYSPSFHSGVCGGRSIGLLTLQASGSEKVKLSVLDLSNSDSFGSELNAISSVGTLLAPGALLSSQLDRKDRNGLFPLICEHEETIASFNSFGDQKSFLSFIDLRSLRPSKTSLLGIGRLAIRQITAIWNPLAQIGISRVCAAGGGGDSLTTEPTFALWSRKGTEVASLFQCDVSLDFQRDRCCCFNSKNILAVLFEGGRNFEPNRLAVFDLRKISTGNATSSIPRVAPVSIICPPEGSERRGTGQVPVDLVSAREGLILAGSARNPTEVSLTGFKLSASTTRELSLSCLTKISAQRVRNISCAHIGNNGMFIAGSPSGVDDSDGRLCMIGETRSVRVVQSGLLLAPRTIVVAGKCLFHTT